MVNTNQSMFSYLKEKHSCYKEDSKMISFYGRKIKQKQFFEEIDKVASFLQNKGVKKGDNVIICLGNIPNAIISFYAVNKIGAISNLLHPLVNNNQLEKIIKKTNPKAVIVFDEFLSQYNCLDNFSGPILVCSACDYLFSLYKPFYGMAVYGKTRNNKYGKNIFKYSSIKKESLSNVDIKGNEVAIYMHSSGTTGESKIACISNEAMNCMQENLFSTVFDVDKLDDSWGMIMALPIFHTFGLGVCMHTILCIGAQVILMPKFSSLYASILLKTEPVSMISGIPNMFKKLANSKLFSGKSLRKIKECFCGGEKLSNEIKEKFENKLLKVGNNNKISEGYGLTETGVVLLNTQKLQVNNSIGAPLNNVDVKVLDDNLKELAPFEKGLIFVSSKSIMNEYLNDEKLSQEIIITMDNKKWVNTGDIGYLDDNKNVFFVDREKRIIKISGNNVFPSEIETYVNGIEQINASCAVKGSLNGKTIVKLFVELKDGYQYSKELEQIILNTISSNMLKYAIPSKIECLDKLPKNNVGKIDYKKLLDINP